MMTYGDGLTNQNIKRLESFHLQHKKIATMTIVRPPVRFGEVKLRKNKIVEFKEKPQSQTGWINGGYFVLNSKIFEYDFKFICFEYRGNCCSIYILLSKL